MVRACVYVSVDTGRSHTSFYLHSLCALVMRHFYIGPSLAQLVIFAQQVAFALRACQPQASSLLRSCVGVRVRISRYSPVAHVILSALAVGPTNSSPLRSRACIITACFSLTFESVKNPGAVLAPKRKLMVPGW